MILRVVSLLHPRPEKLFSFLVHEVDIASLDATGQEYPVGLLDQFGEVLFGFFDLGVVGFFRMAFPLSGPGYNPIGQSLRPARPGNRR